LITEQSLRLGSSQQDFAEVALGSLECLDSPPSFFGRLVAFPQVVIEWGWGREVATDHCVDIGQFESVKGLHDGLGSGTSLESMDHQLQEHAAVANAKNPRRLLTEWDRDRERFKINGCHGLWSSVYRFSTIIACTFLIAPRLSVRNRGQAVDFDKSAFGATEVDRLEVPGGSE
jgi:hypothetical protein